MLFINPNHSNVKRAYLLHEDAFRCRVFRKLDIFCLKKGCEICKSRRLVFKSSVSIQKLIIEYLTKDGVLESIIGGMPQDLNVANDSFFRNVLPAGEFVRLTDYFEASKEEKTSSYPVINNLIKDLKKLFDYDWLCDRTPNCVYSLYDLAKVLDRRSCTYCNRTYTTTMTIGKKGKLMRPQFDHWYPKWKYPLLAVSFYNLIPSCYTCNSSSKGRDELSPNEHLHPYLDADQLSEFSFSYINSNVNTYHIYVRAHSDNKKALKTIRALHIDTMYNAHVPELEDMIKLKQAYSESYLEKLREFFPKSSLDDDEVYRLAFGTELNSSDFHKRPMSKFKHDILTELGIIKP